MWISPILPSVYWIFTSNFQQYVSWQIGDSKQMTHVLVLLSVKRLSYRESLFKFETISNSLCFPLFEYVKKLCC